MHIKLYLAHSKEANHVEEEVSFMKKKLTALVVATVVSAFLVIPAAAAGNGQMDSNTNGNYQNQSVRAQSTNNNDNDMDWGWLGLLGLIGLAGLRKKNTERS